MKKFSCFVAERDNFPGPAHELIRAWQNEHHAVHLIAFTVPPGADDRTLPPPPSIARWLRRATVAGRLRGWLRRGVTGSAVREAVGAHTPGGVASRRRSAARPTGRRHANWSQCWPARLPSR